MIFIPELDARFYVDHLSKIFFLIAIFFHIPKILWNFAVGGVLNSYMGYTRLLLDIVKQKLESIPKDGIWGGTEKYHPGRAFDPESKLFSQVEIQMKNSLLIFIFKAPRIRALANE